MPRGSSSPPSLYNLEIILKMVVILIVLMVMIDALTNMTIAIYTQMNIKVCGPLVTFIYWHYYLHVHIHVLMNINLKINLFLSSKMLFLFSFSRKAQILQGVCLTHPHPTKIIIYWPLSNEENNSVYVFFLCHWKYFL